MQFNDFMLGGEIRKIQVSTPKDPKKQPSAIILVQYGERRDPTHGQVEFLNAVMVRIPSYSYPQLAERLKVGASVKIWGHLQGVFKNVMGEGSFSTELVADRVRVDTPRPARREDSAAAEDSSAAGAEASA